MNIRKTIKDMDFRFDIMNVGTSLYLLTKLVDCENQRCRKVTIIDQSIELKSGGVPILNYRQREKHQPPVDIL